MTRPTTVESSGPIGKASNEVTICFPGGKRVEAWFDDRVIPTDQPRVHGGEDSAPAPFDLFLAALGTCTGYYVLSFCQSRGISTADLKIHQRWTRDPTSHRVTEIILEVELPAAFPPKYVTAVLRAAGQCPVKQLLESAPAVEIRVA